ncbi:MAG TPA: DNA circularization N-terminal domain-containing protein [Longimicrobium sp.]|nr:DNA circularization N-terminal domain-containing protein [Longimicrobium sp.]
MPIHLGKLTLDRVHRIATLEESAFVHHRVPGAAGDLLQDMGRRSVRLRIEGICYGAAAADQLATLRGLYTAREPVDFIADVVGRTYVSRVALDRLEVAESAPDPAQFSWTLTVTEYVEPPASAAAAAHTVDAAIAADAGALMEIAALPEMLELGSLPELTNPLPPLSDALTPVSQGMQALQSATSSLRTLLGG